MGALDVLQATKALLSATFPLVPVSLGVPRAWQSPQNFYLYHDQTTQTRLALNLFDRHHIIPICLTILSSQDVEQDEVILAGYTDQVSDLFALNHKLSGTVRDCTCSQGDGRHNPGVTYLIQQGIEYRLRWWTLDAIEQRRITEQA